MKTDEIETPYLMLLNVKEPQPEHAKILEKLNQISNDTAKPIYFDKHGGAFLFVSKFDTRQIYKSFDGILLNEDTFIIVEMGNKWITYGHGSATAWLQKYLSR